MMEDKLSIPSSSLSGGMLAFPDFRHLPPGSLFFDSSGRIIRPADLNVNFQGQGQPQVIPLFMAPSEGMYNPAFKVSGGEAVPRSASTEEGATLLMTSLRTSANSSSSQSSSSSSSSIAGKRKSDELQAAQVLVGKPVNSSAPLGSSIATHIEGAEALYLMNRGASAKEAAAAAEKGGAGEEEENPPSKKAHSSSSSSAAASSVEKSNAKAQSSLAIPFQYYTHWDPNRTPAQDFSRQAQAHPQLLFRPPQPLLAQTWTPHQHRHSIGMGSSAGDLGHKVKVSVGTVSEQQQFLNKVRSCIQLGDIGRLAEILNAAERSSRAVGSSSFSESSSSSSSVLNYQEREQAAEGQALPVQSELQRQAKGATSSAVASSLNRLERQEQPLSVLMEAVNLDGPDVDESSVLNMVNILILHGADGRFCDADNCSCLHILAARGFAAVGKLFLTSGCPPDARTRSAGETAAHLAARHGHTEFLTLLAEFGADLRVRNHQSRSPLDLIGYVQASEAMSGPRPEHPLRDVMRKELLLLEPRLRTLLLFHEDFFSTPSASSGGGGSTGQWDATDR